MAHRVQQRDQRILIPWVIPIKEKSDTPKEILRPLDMIPLVGPLSGTLGIQIVWLQSDNGVELINGKLFT
eukprot:6474748-Prorocentrum_lima.AAC.1